MARRGETWVSEELQAALSPLSGQQAAGVLRIVQAELEGRSLSSLLNCADQICTGTTFYGSGRHSRGWRHKPGFVAALDLARRDYRKWLLEHGVGDALAILAGAAPEAARALRQEVAGDPSAVTALTGLLRSGNPMVRQTAATQLGETGLAEAAPALLEAFEKEMDIVTQQKIVEALGRIAGWRDSDRRAAAFGVLDRADVKTAAKASNYQAGMTTHVIDPETAGTIFDILAQAGAIPTGPDDAEDDEIHPAQTDT